MAWCACVHALFSEMLQGLEAPPCWHGVQELVVHPFWQAKITGLEIPPEPALEAFIQKYNLAPVNEDPRASIASQSAVGACSEAHGPCLLCSPWMLAVAAVVGTLGCGHRSLASNGMP